jgi:hypothetical protein
VNQRPNVPAPAKYEYSIRGADMTSFTFSSDDLKGAPGEVRQWLVARIEADLVKLATAPSPTPPTQAPALAACTPEEAARVLDLLRGDFAATQVFIELARETSVAEAAAPLHAISIGSLMRHTRLDDGALVSCLQTINRAFQEVRNDPSASLFGFDQASHVFIHQATHDSIRSLWQQLVRMHGRPAPETEQLPLPSDDFRPRQLGPSEDVAAHRP